MFKYKDNLDQWHEVAELDENGKVLEEQLPDMASAQFKEWESDD